MARRVRIAVITEIIAPYRIPVFNAAAQRGDIELKVVFLAENDPSLREWRIYKDEIRFSYEVVPSYRWKMGKASLLLNWGTGKALEEAAPDVIVCGGYNYPASWRAMSWARRHKVPFVLWSESTTRDIRKGRWIVDRAKKRFVDRSTAFLVPGSAARQYLLELGVRESQVYVAPNAVDNEFYARHACLARQQPGEIRTKFDLPERYFVCVGRIVPDKGVFDLLRAYERLAVEIRKDVGLVFVGDGGARVELAAAVAKVAPGRIRLLGFMHREQLASVYGLAEALVFPTHTDTWGLVVNEAMASGLPVLVSDVAGCANDLVRPDWNGFVLPRSDVKKWSEAMRLVVMERDLRQTMGRNSESRIREFSPVSWAAGLADLRRQVEQL